MWQAAILARDVVEIFFKRHYFYDICLIKISKDGIGFKQMKFVSLYCPLFRMRRNLYFSDVLYVFKASKYFLGIFLYYE